jgi:hypothetical protein
VILVKLITCVTGIDARRLLGEVEQVADFGPAVVLVAGIVNGVISEGLPGCAGRLASLR